MAWVKATGDFKKNPKWDYLKEKNIKGIMTRKALDITAKKLCFYDVEVQGKGTFSILGTTVINRVLRELPEGTMVDITYTGKTKGKNGTEFNSFEISYNTEPGVDELANTVLGK